MMFATKNIRLVILLFALPFLFGSNEANGQSETNKFDFYLKADAGSLFNKNVEKSVFKPEATVCFGSHFVTKYSFNKLGVSA